MVDQGPTDPVETILVADDDDGVRTLAVQTLKDSGFRVLSARNGVEALEIAQSATGPIDLLVTDMVMSQMGGIQLATRLTKQWPNLKVLYMTGFVEAGSIPQEATILLQKPFAPHTLVERVRDVLDRGRPRVAKGVRAGLESRGGMTRDNMPRAQKSFPSAG